MAANCSHFSAMSGCSTHEREYNTPCNWLNSSTVAISDHFTDNMALSDFVPILLGEQVISGYQAILFCPRTNYPGQPGYEASQLAAYPVWEALCHGQKPVHLGHLHLIARVLLTLTF